MIVVLDPTGGGNRLTVDQIDRLAAGEDKIKILYARDYLTPRSVKLSEVERIAFEDAKRLGYYNVKPAKVHLLAHYWHETTGRPPVEVRFRGRLATVTMDLISLPRAAQLQWQDHPDLGARMAALASIHGGRIFSCGTYNHIRAVPRENADACAAALRDLFDDITAVTP